MSMTFSNVGPYTLTQIGNTGKQDLIHIPVDKEGSKSVYVNKNLIATIEGESGAYKSDIVLINGQRIPVLAGSRELSEMLAKDETPHFCCEA